MDIKDLGHWTSTLDVNPEEWFGFVYRVTNLQNGMQYIGRKQFNSRTRKKVKGRKNRKVVIKESNWRKYTTSSKRVQEAIDAQGMDDFKFEIIELCATKGDLSYREVEIQWEEKVLSAKLDNGERKYYNGTIGAIKFQLSKHREETKKKIGLANKGLKRTAAQNKANSERNKGHTRNTGVPRSDETKQKLREANLGKKASKETRQLMSDQRKGRETSDEWRENLSKANKGKPWSKARRDAQNNRTKTS